MKRQRKPVQSTTARVLCQVCFAWFELPRQCLECSNWNVCEECLRQQSQETRRVLAERGVTLPYKE